MNGQVSVVPEVAAARYSLLCRALTTRPAGDAPYSASLDALHAFVHAELLAFARQASPDDIVEIYRDFSWELERFREFCAFPDMAGKTVVAFGGGFSAGKSSLINAILGSHLLVTDIDPTTALPAYLMKGNEDRIWAMNLHHQRVELMEEEFKSLTHEERDRYGSDAARAFSAAFIQRGSFPWAHLALIDTPGYSAAAKAGERTDSELALAQLSSAHAVVWTVPLKQGEIPETDLQFLARLDPETPLMVVATRADQLDQADVPSIVKRMAQTLSGRNLRVTGVFAASSRPSASAGLQPILQQLQQWNQPRPQRFAHRFKHFFTRYQRGLARERADAMWRDARLKRLALLIDRDGLRDVDELQARTATQLAALDDAQARLSDMRSRFFTELRRVGQAVGIALPEPHEIDLLDPARSNLVDRLIALREAAAAKVRVDMDALTRALESLQSNAAAKFARRLTRKTPHPAEASVIRPLTKAADVHGRLLGRITGAAGTAFTQALGKLKAPGPAPHITRPLRLNGISNCALTSLRQAKP